MHGDEPGYQILIKSDKSYNAKFTEVYQELDLAVNADGKSKDDVETAKKYICKNYFDVRAFGAVMNIGDDKYGVVRGSVQFTFAKSISPITVYDITMP